MIGNVTVLIVCFFVCLSRFCISKKKKINKNNVIFLCNPCSYILLLHTMFQFRLVHVGSLGVTSPYCLRDVSQPRVLDDAEEPVELVLCHALLNVEQNALNFGLVVQRRLWKWNMKRKLYKNVLSTLCIIGWLKLYILKFHMLNNLT